MPPPTLLAQGTQDVFHSLQNFGVAVTMLLLMTVAFFAMVWYAAKHLLPKWQSTFEAQIKQLREDYKEDREHDRVLINLQRTEFLSALHHVTQMQREELTTFREAIGRIEKCLDALTREVQSLNRGK